MGKEVAPTFLILVKFFTNSLHMQEFFMVHYLAGVHFSENFLSAIWRNLAQLTSEGSRPDGFEFRPDEGRIKWKRRLASSPIMKSGQTPLL